MAEVSVLKIVEEYFEVLGVGETDNKATEAAFADLRKKVFEKFDKPIIQMQAIEAMLLEKNITSKTERFLYIFFPRERKTVSISLKILVELKYLDI